MTELERRAMLGDRQAQKGCTEKGIALPCPLCERSVKAIMNGTAVYHVYTDCLIDARLVSLEKWNTRPAPPAGRCGECKFYTVTGYCKVHSQEPDQYGSGAYVEMLPNDFCSYFEPREETDHEIKS